MVGTDGEMYHYDFFDQRANRFSNLLVYRLDEQAWRLRAVTRATDALFRRPPTRGSGRRTAVDRPAAAGHARFATTRANGEDKVGGEIRRRLPNAN